MRESIFVVAVVGVGGFNLAGWLICSLCGMLSFGLYEATSGIGLEFLYLFIEDR